MMLRVLISCLIFFHTLCLTEKATPCGRGGVVSLLSRTGVGHGCVFVFSLSQNAFHTVAIGILVTEAANFRFVSVTSMSPGG